MCLCFPWSASMAAYAPNKKLSQTTRAVMHVHVTANAGQYLSLHSSAQPANATMYIYKAMHSGLSASEEAEALGEADIVMDGMPKETLAVQFKEREEATDAAPDLQEGTYWADLPSGERCKWIWRDQVQVPV